MVGGCFYLLCEEAALAEGAEGSAVAAVGAAARPGLALVQILLQKKPEFSWFLLGKQACVSG